MSEVPPKGTRVGYGSWEGPASPIPTGQPSFGEAFGAAIPPPACDKIRP